MSRRKGESRLLPLDFVPSDKDVVCGRDQESIIHDGNLRLRGMIREILPMYQQEKTKKGKTNLVVDIVDRIRRGRPDGGFVRKDLATGRWVEIGGVKAREKVGHLIRIELKKKMDEQKDGGSTISSGGKIRKQSALQNINTAGTMDSSAGSTMEQSFDDSSFRQTGCHHSTHGSIPGPFESLYGDNMDSTSTSALFPFAQEELGSTASGTASIATSSTIAGAGRAKKEGHLTSIDVPAVPLEAGGNEDDIFTSQNWDHGGPSHPSITNQNSFGLAFQPDKSEDTINTANPMKRTLNKSNIPFQNNAGTAIMAKYSSLFGQRNDSKQKDFGKVDSSGGGHTNLSQSNQKSYNFCFNIPPPGLSSSPPYFQQEEGSSSNTANFSLRPLPLPDHLTVRDSQHVADNRVSCLPLPPHMTVLERSTIQDQSTEDSVEQQYHRQEGGGSRDNSGSS